MSVKVVNGIIGFPKPTTNVKPEVQPNSANNIVQNAYTSVTQKAFVSNEAVNISVRAAKTFNSEKIRDYREAKQVSEDIADKIEKGGDLAEAHDSLKPVSAKNSFL